VAWYGDPERRIQWIDPERGPGDSLTYYQNWLSQDGSFSGALVPGYYDGNAWGTQCRRSASAWEIGFHLFDEAADIDVGVSLGDVQW